LVSEAFTGEHLSDWVIYMIPEEETPISKKMLVAEVETVPE
jgi:hypothetical protein